MIMWNNRLCPKEEEVAAKVMDGEAIIINFSNGIYYSLDKVGGLVWELIEGSSSPTEIVEVILEHYEASPEQVNVDIEKLVAELIQENLVTASDVSGANRDNKPLAPQQKLPYESPHLNVYRDMGQLLALDPPMPGLKDISWKEPEPEVSSS